MNLHSGEIGSLIVARGGKKCLDVNRPESSSTRSADARAVRGIRSRTADNVSFVPLKYIGVAGEVSALAAFLLPNLRARFVHNSTARTPRSSPE